VLALVPTRGLPREAEEMPAAPAVASAR
jgi:hypothetical protein